MTVAELGQRMGSAELAEWIAELGILRPEEERDAIERAKAEAEGRPYAEAPTAMTGGAPQARQDVPWFGPEGPPGFWTAEERARQKKGTSAADLAQLDSLIRGTQDGAVS